MGFFKRLKERMRSIQSISGKEKRAASQSAIKGETGERLLSNQGDLIQNVDTLGGVATDGLNRFV